MKSLIAFFEIPAADFSRATRFYEAILDLPLSVAECGKKKMAFFPEENGASPGAISFSPGFVPSAHGVLLSLHEKIWKKQSPGSRMRAVRF